MKRIVVVDNNPVMLEFMNEILTQEGHTVHTLENGVEALEFCRNFVPDVIFVDLIMPYIDGKQLCRLLRKEKALLNTRIVIISGIAAEEPDFNFKEIADAYIAKMPFRVMKTYIIDVIEKLEVDAQSISKNIIGLDQIYNRDITKELLFSKEHLEVLLSSISDGFFELNSDKKVIYLNEAGADFFGIKRDEMLTQEFSSFFPQDLSLQIEDVLNSNNDEEIELGVQEPILLNGRFIRIRFTSVSYSSYRSRIVMMQDITSQKEAEKIVKEDLKEKELLLKEVHHRVKNNLNVVASLLNLQTSFLTDDSTKKHLTDSKNRVESMALIHEQLYNTEDLSGVYLDSYLNDLVTQLVHIYDTHTTPVKTILDIPPMHLSLSMAVPLGLIVNELIANSLEHGLKEMENGYIHIILHDEPQDFRLEIRDNGKGLPANFDIDKNESLGLLLVSNLAQQIGGSFSIYNENGTTAIVEFSINDNTKNNNPL